MSRLEASDLYKTHLFYTSQITFKRFSEKNFISYHHLIDAVMEGVYNPDMSIVDNVNVFIKSATDRIKLDKEFGEAIEYFKKTIQNLDEDALHKFYNTSLIDYILGFDLVPYEQVDITKMYFMNPYGMTDDKLKFLHSQINAIYTGGYDYRILNSLDKIKLNPEFLQNDTEYQRFMEFLVINYLVSFSKYNGDKNENKFARYIIRMIYRHQNRGYFIPGDDLCYKIVNVYAFNGWFKELKFMIENNKLGISKDNYMNFIKQVHDGFNNMVGVCNFSSGQYIEMYERFNKIIEGIVDVAENNQKLSRKEE